ncbi:MAG TPA: Uma2 family endonuclease [Gemmatimonadales bacterium]|nr:Uma2 family endonuclease [Gemmatimonadales bacterium]
MQSAAPFCTADMVRDLIVEEHAWPRHETVHGELLVTPAPRMGHQELVRRILVALSSYLDQHGPAKAHVLMSPADISWGPDSLVQPDIFVVPIDEARPLRWSGIAHLLLAVEVLSPSSVRADRFTKRRLYQENGVGLYWVIDIDGRSAEAWRPESVQPELIRDRLTWHPAGAAEPFVMGLEELFRPV